MIAQCVLLAVGKAAAAHKANGENNSGWSSQGIIRLMAVPLRALELAGRTYAICSIIIGANKS